MKASWPILAIVLALVVFFYPIWLFEKVPLPADIVAGAYFPWLDYKWGYPTGVPVKNPITTDVTSFIYPMQTYAVEILKGGAIPLWNPLIFGGTPLLANFQSAIFSPANIFFLLLPTIWAWTAQIIAQPFLGALWMFFLLRYLKVSKSSSVIGGLTFAFSGFMLIWLEWNGHSLAAGLIPLLLLLLGRFLENAQMKYGILISLVLCLQFFSGYPQIVIYSLIAMAIFYLTTQRGKLLDFKLLTKISVLIVLGVSLAAIQILPAYELLRLSQRDVEELSNASAFLPFIESITFFAPDYFGNHATGNYWGPTDYTSTTGYTGLVAVIFSSIGVLKFWKVLAVRFFFFLAVTGLILSFPTPISIWFKEQGVLGLQAASAHRSLILFNLGIAGLAAFGIDAVLKRSVAIKDVIRSLYLPGVFLVAFGVVTLFSYVASLSTLKEIETQDLLKLKVDSLVGLRNLVLPVGLSILSLALLFFAIYVKKLTKPIVLFLSLLVLLELFRFGWKFTPFSPTHLVYPKTPILEFLERGEKPSRVYAEGVIPINIPMAYRLETPEGYDAVYPLDWAKYLAVLNSSDVDARPMGRYGSIDKPDSRLLDLANAKYVLVLKKDITGKPDSLGVPRGQFALPSFLEVFEDKTVVVLENQNVLPRAFMVYDWEVLPDRNNILSRLLDENFPLQKKIILENEVGVAKEKDSSFSVDGLDYQANRLDLLVTTEKEGLLFVSDSWYPGWKATIDSLPTQILRANYTFRAVVVPAGTHDIKFIYSPESFKIGKFVSGVSLLILLVILFVRRKPVKGSRK